MPSASSGLASGRDDQTRTEVLSSIIAGNVGTDIDVVDGANLNSIVSQGHNLVGTGSGVARFSPTRNDLIGVDPQLGPLANNGGTTLTIALLAGSPAIDAGSSSSYAAAVFADDPVAYWRLGEDPESTSIAVNLGTVGGIDGAYQGDVSAVASLLTSDPNNGAVAFDGDADFVAIPDSLAINKSPIDAYTIELVFNAQDVDNRGVLYEQGGSTRGFNVYIEAGRIVAGAWAGSGNDFAAFIDSDINADTTYHLAVVFDSTLSDPVFEGFLNGVRFAGVHDQDIDGVITPLPVHNDDIGIGGVRGSTRFDNDLNSNSGNGVAGNATDSSFLGTIDEVALYRRALTAEDIASHVNPPELPAIDQRGVTRPQRAARDIGAFEAEPEVQIDLRLVTLPTSTDINGETATLPDDAAFIDEWDDLFIEVWASTPDDATSAVGSFELDVPFDQNVFEAFSIEYGPQFTVSQQGRIDNANGIITSLGAATSRTDAGRDRFVLLATLGLRVRSEADLPNDQVGSYILPNLDQEFVVEIQAMADASGTTTRSRTSPPRVPRIWPVMYDLDDNGQIGFGDLANFADLFNRNTTSDSRAFQADFDHDGSVGFGDLAFFADNFGRSRTLSTRRTYATNFPAAWESDALRGQFSGLAQSDSLSPLPSLTESVLREVRDAATELFQDAGLSAEELESIQSVPIQIVDLPDGYLGLETNAGILIDVDASGSGWFIDSSPREDSEFQMSDGVGKAVDTSARERFDLLTVVAHELGHHLGLQHDDHGLMEDTLLPGERRNIEHEVLDYQFSKFTELNELLEL